MINYYEGDQFQVCRKCSNCMCTCTSFTVLSNLYFVKHININVLKGGDQVTLENEVKIQDVDEKKSCVEVCNFIW